MFVLAQQNMRNLPIRDASCLSLLLSRTTSLTFINYSYFTHSNQSSGESIQFIEIYLVHRNEDFKKYLMFLPIFLG